MIKNHTYACLYITRFCPRGNFRVPQICSHCVSFFPVLLFFFTPSLLFLVHLPPNLAVNQMFTLPCYY